MQEDDHSNFDYTFSSLTLYSPPIPQKMVGVCSFKPLFLRRTQAYLAELPTIMSVMNFQYGEHRITMVGNSNPHN